MLYPRLISFEIDRVIGCMRQGWRKQRWSGMDACLRGPFTRAIPKLRSNPQG